MGEKALLSRVSVSVLVAIAIPVSALAQTTSSIPAPKPIEPPTVTTVLPADTPGLVLINTELDAWAELNQFNPLPNIPLPLSTLPFESEDFNLKQDVFSWLGNRVAIALLPPRLTPNNPTSVSPPPDGSVPVPSKPKDNARAAEKALMRNVVFLVPIKDTQRFNSFLDKAQKKWGKPQIERDYKGTTILQWTPSLLPNDPVLETPDAPPADASPLKPEVTPTPSPQASPPVSPQAKRLTPALLSPTLLSPATKAPELAIATPILASGIPPTDLPKDLEENQEVDPSPSPSPTDAPGPGNLVVALLPGVVALSNQAQPLETLIDARSGQPSLAQNPLFQRTLNHPQFGRSLFTSYGDIGGMFRYLEKLPNTIPNLPLPQLLPQIEATVTKAYSTVDSHTWVKPEGIHSQTSVYYTTPQPTATAPFGNNPNQILTHLPAVTYLAANSYNFKQQWQTFTAVAKYDASSQLFLDSMRSGFRSGFGLDLEKDLISWMDKEYAFFLYPSKGGALTTFSPNLNLGLGLILQTSDRPTAEATLNRLNHYFRSLSRGDLKIVSRRFKDQPVTSWEVKERGKTLSVLAYGWLNKDTLLFTTGIGAMPELMPKPYLPLHLNNTFSTATTTLPSPNEGYFYVNMGATLSFLYSLFPPATLDARSPFVQEAKRVIGTIRSVSSTNSFTTNAVRLDSLWVLGQVKPKPGNNPQPSKP